MSIELVLPQSCTPALKKKKEEILHGYRTSTPAVPHLAHGYMGIELVLPQSRTPALGSWIIERGIFMCIVCKYLLTAGLREQNINVMQLWPGILKFSQKKGRKKRHCLS